MLGLSVMGPSYQREVWHLIRLRKRAKWPWFQLLGLRRRYSAEMTDAEQYLAKTESATRHLFSAVESYFEPLRQNRVPVYVSGEMLGDPATDESWIAWREEHADQIQAAFTAQRKFSAEFFSMSMLCGAILQIAEKGLELHARTRPLNSRDEDWRPHLGKSLQLAKYCAGRQVHGVPIGLVIYAGRNQHAHFEGTLREPSATVIERLATAKGYRDPALDAARLGSLAANITYLLDWRGYDAYLGDMRALLEVADDGAVPPPAGVAP